MKTKIALLFAVWCCFLSCKKLIQLQPSPVLVEQDKIFVNEQAATSALLGLYVQMMNASLNMANGGLSVYPSLSADELYHSAPGSIYEPFTLNTLTDNNSIVNANFWRSAYICIYHANALIEGLQNSSVLPSTVNDQLLGEARFARAWYYFTLTNLFGEIPLVISTNYQQNAILAKTSVNRIYEQIEEDLRLAKSKMGENYPTTGRVRPNKWAASALLARVYLYQQNWQMAEKEATEVIGTGKYQLQSDLNNVFLANNNESVLQIWKENSNTAEAATFIPASTSVKPTLIVTDNLLNSFELDDKRKLAWLKANNLSGQLYYYPNKYKARTNSPLVETKQLLRIAEQYLIRAEARTHLNLLDSAIGDLNKIRIRAGLLGLTALSQSSLLLAIEKERQKELFAEDGHRWFDLKRWGKATTVLNPIKSSWRPEAILYPIPLAELERNLFLTQNPGY